MSNSSQSAANKDYLSDPSWRLDNLYWIKDKDGQAVPFSMNWAQRELLDRFWHRNLVLKVRQIGITTFYCLLELDTALFSPGTSVGIIAHTKDDAKKIFRDKIKFAYDRLPQDLRAVVPAKANSASEILFANGSSIYVGVTMRSATVQMLHITEYGYICAKFPQRAEEIRTGAMEAVPAGGAITIESTAMGRFGHFYELVDAAQKRGTDTIARADYRLVFLPWWKHPEYEEPGQTTLSPAEAQYFNSVQASAGRVVNAGQKTWYIAKWRALGEKVKSEYPSTIKEAFQRSVEGAYYEQQMTQARMDGRVTKVPHEPGALVHTWWDLGVGDATAIWFAQEIGREIRLIDYYENSGEGLPHYVKELTERREKLGYIYGRHIGPHDIKVREFSSGQSRIHRAKELGLDFEVAPNLPIDDGIEAVRNMLSLCWFDDQKCIKGIDALEHYRKEWNDALATYRDKPLHDWASHGADAARTGAVTRRANQRARAKPVRQVRWA